MKPYVRASMCSLFCLSMLLGGCKKVEPAPEELDDLTHFFFLEFDGEEALLVEGVDNLLAWNEKNGDPAGVGGSITKIDQRHRDAVGLTSKASFEFLTGVYELREHPDCSVEDFSSIYLFKDQPTLFPDEYEDYSRTYDGNEDCFLDQTCDRAEYEIWISDRMIGKSLEYTLVIQLRRLLDADGALSAVVARTWMPSEALVGGETDSATFFDQSYQIEVFAPRKGQRSLHHYGLWNSGGVRGFSSDGDFWKNQYLDGVTEWNDHLDRLCDQDRGLWDR
jgi:hypothetical protein